jgi:cell wall-associated NlpC family hydrolase
VGPERRVLTMIITRIRYFTALVATAAFSFAGAYIAGTAGGVANPPVSAVLTARTMTVPDTTIGQKILDKAETKRGYWYVYGDAGPSYFDCSGLVYWASHQLGVNLPRTTYEQMDSSLVYRVYTPQRGDLAFFGSGHVEFVTSYYHQTFGAQQSGTRLGWHPWGGSYQPTAYYRIR